MPFLRVTQSPVDIPDDHPFGGDANEHRVEAVRFMDARYQSCYNLLNEVSWELAQTHARIEILEKRLRKYEEVAEWEPLPMLDRETHERVSL